MRVVLLTNPISGKADHEQVRGVEQVLAERAEVARFEPSSSEDLDELREVARSAQLLVVAGGDGTLNRAVNAVGEQASEVVWGLVPMGTGNDLARTLGLPTDPVEAATVARDGRIRTIDVCKASGAGAERLFVNGCVGGFPVEVDEAVDADAKRRLGPLAFWIGGIKASARIQRFTASIDGEQRADCLAAGVGNGTTCGGGIRMWPDARPDDGLLDACALGAPGPAAAVALAARVRSGTHQEMKEVLTYRERAITISADPEIEFNVDGELVGLKSPAKFEVVDALSIKSARG